MTRGRARTLLLALFALMVAAALITDARASVRIPEPAGSAIRLASITYRVPLSEMIRVARCETGGTFSPSAYNRSSGASGLFQFLPSTWRRTPYAGFSVFHAHANALAAAWLYVQDGRSWREWSCAPH